MDWYQNASLINNDGNVNKSVFIHVWSEGKLIDSVPIERRKLEKELGIQLRDTCTDTRVHSGKDLSVEEFRHLTFRNEIQWHQINETNYQDEMMLCLENYPFGNPPKQYHARCIQLKERVFAEVFSTELIAGVYSTWGGKVLGLIEVFPREIIKQYGFITGREGKDEDYLTVGCLEVGFGVPRKEMIDELMFQLEMAYSAFHRPKIEGAGRLEWNTGFTPYWVYDKYGFHRSEKISEKLVIMEKKIH